jgi:hypothetical protein
MKELIFFIFVMWIILGTMIYAEIYDNLKPKFLQRVVATFFGGPLVWIAKILRILVIYVFRPIIKWLTVDGYTS